MNLIPSEESLTVEFKSDVKKSEDTDVVEAVVGLANTRGGELYIGVENDGTITGLHPSRQNLARLAAIIANKTVPPLLVRIEVIEAERPVVKVEVPFSRTIVSTANGRMLRRRLKADGTPENIPLYPHEVSGRLSALGLLDYSAQAVVNATVDDFDVLERQRLRRIIRTHGGEPVLLELNDEELDKALQLVTTHEGKLIPTVAGMLLLGKTESIKTYLPTASVGFQVLQGTDVKVNDIFTLPLLAAFERLEEYMKAWNPEKEMEMGLVRVPIPEFSKRAFREAIVNAFSHRDYSILQMVRVLIDDDGLTISSPGGFVEGVTIKNLLTVEPRSRNPVLADALKRLGLAERTGRGIDRIYEGSLIYGRPLPDYSESDENTVKLFIQRAEPDRAFAQMIYDEQNRRGGALPIHSLLILSSLREERRLSLSRLAEIINLSESRTRASVERLTESGLVEARGTGRGRYYILSSEVYKKCDNTLEYVRQTDIDRVRYPELVIKLAKTQGQVSRKNVAELLRISDSQAYRVLKRLADEGYLKMLGKGRGARYVISKK